MSGDVQPRKRKDKKRRKDDSVEQSVPVPPQINPQLKENTDDVNIHVYNERGTGGNICSKIIFVFLSAALIVLIGLIITEYRGLTDLDTAVDSESKYAQIFEGWVDNSLDDHDHDQHQDIDELVGSHEADDELDDNFSEGDDEHELDEDQLQVSEELENNPEEDDDVTQEDDEEDDEIQNQEDDDDADEEDNNEVLDDDDEQNVVDDEDDDDEDDDNDIDDDNSTGDVSTEKQDDDEENSSRIVESQEDDVNHEDEDEEEETDVDEDNVDYNLKEESKSIEVDDNEQKTASEENSAQDAPEEDDIKRYETDENEEKVKDDGDEEEGEEPAEDHNGSTSGSNRVNAKEEPGPDAYEHKDITNEADWQIKDKIDEAQKSIKNNAAYAIKRFDAILEQFPNSPRSLYGKAAALDKLADERRSNDILRKAVDGYIDVLNNKNTPDKLFEIVANQCIARLRFLGHYRKAISVHNALIERFPDNCTHSNQLAVTYLTINRISEARSVLRKILSTFPNDGFALVHFGFILKTSDNNLKEAVTYMRKGINTGDDGVIDGRFFFHLGDALTRLGRTEEALKLYEDGVKYGLFLSKYQRSLYNVERLTAKPWWRHEDISSRLLKDLEKHWRDIRKEAESILSEEGYFQDESENLRDRGDWKQFELFARGQKNHMNCRKCPITCEIIERHPEARFCKRGQTKFSVMHPDTHVWPHCGPTNCRLRLHLALRIPSDTYIRVADDMRSWKEGKVLIFDDSFEHEVWHNGTGLRLVLIVDIWHPELTESEKNSLSPI